MTTNVFCKKNNVLASDSRWSFKLRENGQVFAVAYVDDTGYDKIVYDEDTGYIFAGPGDVIERWRQWAMSPNQPVLKRPAVADDFAICMTDLETGEILMEHGQKVSDADCRTAGTGAKPAYDCWTVNKDARRAVQSATKHDHLSGGTVKFLIGANRSNNLDLTIPVGAVNECFLTKGMVMYVNSHQQPVPVAQAASSDPRIADVLKKAASGEVSAEAPSGYDPVVWTPTDEARLDSAIDARNARRAQRKAAAGG